MLEKEYVENLEKEIKNSGLAASLKKEEFYAAKMELVESQGHNPLSYAAIANDMDFAEHILKNNKNWLYKIDEHGRSPLHESMKYHDNPHMVDLLLRHGAAWEMKTVKDGKTALHYAGQTGNLATIEMLVEGRKADINARDNYGNTALHYAALEGKDQVVNYLLDKGVKFVTNKEGQTPAHAAASRGHLRTLNNMAKRDINTEIADKKGRTPGEYLNTYLGSRNSGYRASSYVAQLSQTRPTTGLSR